MDLGLQDKVAIVTGGSRGIGRAIAQSLAAEGCQVAISARDTGGLADTATPIREPGGGGWPATADTSQTPATRPPPGGRIFAFGGVGLPCTNAACGRGRGDTE